jgi:REP element-mobilizing transposase RayT
MPRLPRPELAGGIHHVYSRGAVKQPIFIDDLDRRRYLSILAKVTHRMAWRCLAYCLMGNHMHLLIETPEPNLGRGMQRLHGTYGQAFNRRHEAAGHVFGSRFGSTSILTDPQFFVTVAYIARNPVEAGLCNAPEAWPWSSHLAVASARWPCWLDARGLLSRFGQDGGDALQRYLEFVAAEPKRT